MRPQQCVTLSQRSTTLVTWVPSNVADIVTALRVIAGPDGIDHACVPVPLGDPVSTRLRGLRVVVLPDDLLWPVATSTHDAVERAVQILERLGVVRAAVALPLDLSESLDITQRYWNRGRVGFPGGLTSQSPWAKRTR